MGKLIVHNAVTINGAFEAPTPDEWLVLDDDSGDASLEQLILADALVLGRRTYEGLAAVWPQLADHGALIAGRGARTFLSTDASDHPTATRPGAARGAAALHGREGTGRP